jgi:transposase InsO family protein
METVHTAIPTLEVAVANRKARECLLFHSDRGHSIARKPFGKLWENCRDNACAESFFKTLKRDLETLDGKHTAGVGKTIGVHVC